MCFRLECRNESRMVSRSQGSHSCFREHVSTIRPALNEQNRRLIAFWCGPGVRFYRWCGLNHQCGSYPSPPREALVRDGCPIEASQGGSNQDLARLGAAMKAQVGRFEPYRAGRIVNRIADSLQVSLALSIPIGQPLHLMPSEMQPQATGTPYLRLWLHFRSTLQLFNDSGEKCVIRMRQPARETLSWRSAARRQPYV